MAGWQSARLTGDVRTREACSGGAGIIRHEAGVRFEELQVQRGGAGRDVWTLPGAEGQGQWQGQAGPMHLPCRVHPEPVERWKWTRGPNRDECPAALGSQVMQSRELVVKAPPFTPKPPSLNVPPGVKSKPLCEPHTPPSASDSVATFLSVAHSPPSHRPPGWSSKVRQACSCAQGLCTGWPSI